MLKQDNPNIGLLTFFAPSSGLIVFGGVISAQSASWIRTSNSFRFSHLGMSELDQARVFVYNLITEWSIPT